ncbi:GNAT family N-acetyltransferase [Nocardioides litoris]|uniref:GNAT family N-acetyltransferase n=1 Tax=Nocardioides litoris TaxID=1926648 RepID=UPI001122D16E|nr:GNAT family N-acetyltransferase [Nocardioides litoris]
MPDLHLHHVTDPDTTALLARLQRRRYAHEHGDPEAALGAARALLERLGEHGQVLHVLRGADVVGELLVRDHGAEQGVVDVVLDDPADAPVVCRLVEQRARAAGAGRLTVTVSPGDPVAAALVAGGGFSVAATQMRLDLAAEPPPEPVVSLVPMDEAGFAAWEAEEVESYAAERARSGEDPERALQVSREQHAELLPEGLATPHHHFFVGLVDGAPVGTLWLCTEKPTAFVFDVVVDEAHRRRGYGAGLMRAGARWARDHGALAIGLNVFGHNHGARALYDRLGYVVTEDFWGKPL